MRQPLNRQTVELCRCAPPCEPTKHQPRALKLRQSSTLRNENASRNSKGDERGGRLRRDHLRPAARKKRRLNTRRFTSSAINGICSGRLTLTKSPRQYESGIHHGRPRYGRKSAARPTWRKSYKIKRASFSSVLRLRLYSRHRFYVAGDERTYLYP